MRKLVAGAGSGGQGKPNDSAFYAAALSASGSRLVVRDWLETTVGEVKQSLARYFRLQRLVEPDGGSFQPLGIGHLAWTTVHRIGEQSDHDKLFPNVATVLLRCALE